MPRLLVVGMRFFIFIMDPLLCKLHVWHGFLSNLFKRRFLGFWLLDFFSFVDDSISSKPVLSGCHIHLIPILSQTCRSHRSVLICVISHSLWDSSIIIFISWPLILLISLLLKVLLIIFKLLHKTRIRINITLSLPTKEHRWINWKFFISHEISHYKCGRSRYSCPTKFKKSIF